MDCCCPSLEGNKEPEKKKQKLEDNSSEEHDVAVLNNNTSNNNNDDEEEDQALLYDSDGYSDNETRQRDLLKYNQQLQDSNGFQVDYFPKLGLFGMFNPVHNPETDDLLSTLSQLAIDVYNKDNVGAHYEFVRAVRSTYYGCAGLVHYITFEAKLPDAADAETFQAKVYTPYPKSDIEVISCELKATN